MFKIENIIDGNDNIFFLKIIERKYLGNFISNGQIYFNTLEHFRNMENNSSLQAIGDNMECSLTKKVADYILVDGKYIEFHGPNSGNNVRLNANQCVFCCYTVGVKNCQKLSDNYYVHRMPYSTIERICNDKYGIGNCVLIAFDNAIIYRVYEKLKEKQLSYEGKNVKYDDYEYVPENDTLSYEYQLEACFHKELKYDYQNEFRIAVLNKTNSVISDLYINVDENDFSVFDLKENMDFVSYIMVNEIQTQGEICTVSFDIKLKTEEGRLYET